MENLYGSPVLMVEQPSQLLADGYYHVYDGNGMPVAHVRELMPTRQFMGAGGRHRPHRFGIFSPDGEPVLTLDKPWQNGLPNIYVTDAHGGPVGCIIQDLKFTGSRFWLQDANGNNIGRIEGDFGNWHFEVYDGHGQVAAQIDQQYTGLFSGQWNTDDRYALQFHYDPDEWLRMLVVASAITIDVMLHDTKRDTRFYAYGTPDMWMGDPFYFDRPGFWGPRAGWDGYFGYYGPRWYSRRWRGGYYYGSRVYGPRWSGGRYVGARYYRPRYGVRYRPRVGRPAGYRGSFGSRRRAAPIRGAGAPRGVVRGRTTGSRRGNDGVDRRGARGAGPSNSARSGGVPRAGGSSGRGAAPRAGGGIGRGGAGRGGAPSSGGGRFGTGGGAGSPRGRATGGRSSGASGGVAGRRAAGPASGGGGSRGQATGGRGSGFGASASRGRPSGGRAGGFGSGGSAGRSSGAGRSSSAGRSRGGGLFGGGSSRGGRSGGGLFGGGSSSRRSSGGSSGRRSGGFGGGRSRGGGGGRSRGGGGRRR